MKTKNACSMQARGVVARLFLMFVGLLAASPGYGALPPEIVQGLGWLSIQVAVDGQVAGENASQASPGQVQSEVARTLATLATPNTALTQRLAASGASHTEHLARLIIAKTDAGLSAASETNLLMARQNADGGYGGDAGYTSNPLDTAWAITALKASGRTEETVDALAYLRQIQLPDGGYALSDSAPQADIFVTASVLAVMRDNSLLTNVGAAINAAVGFLDAKRNGSASWGSLVDSAVAYLAVKDFLPAEPLASQVRDMLANAQMAAGYWSDGDPYITAIALRAWASSLVAPFNPLFGKLTGAIVDARSLLPLDGAIVTLSKPGFSLEIVAAAGEFAPSGLAPGEYRLTISHPGYAILTSQITLGAGRIVALGTIRLIPNSGVATGTIVGMARDITSGQSLSGVNIDIIGTTLRATTDGAGDYQIVGVPVGTVSLRATKPGYTTVAGQGAVSQGGQMLFSPGMAPGPESETALQGKVTDATTGLPIQGAMVVLSGANHANGQTLPDGAYRFTNLAPGTVHVVVTATGYQSAALQATLIAETTSFLSIDMVPSGQPGPSPMRVTGVVVDAVDNKLLQGVRIVSAGSTVHTDEHGRFEVPKSDFIEFARVGYINGALTFESTTQGLLTTTDLGTIRLLRENYQAALLPDLSVVGVDARGLNTDPITLATSGIVIVNLMNFGSDAPVSASRVMVYEDIDGDGLVSTTDGLLGLATLHPDAPAASQTITVSVPVTGYARAFRNSRLLAVADARNEVPEVQETNNLGMTTCGASVFPFIDDFNDGIYDGWTEIDGHTSDIRRIENSVLVVYPKQSFSAHWTGSRDWTDYAVEVRLRFPEGGSNDAGIQYRHLGAEIHSGDTFRIKANHARLIHRGNTVLESPFSVEANRWYTLRAEVVDQHVLAYIDNQLVFDYQAPPTDTMNSHGAAGLQEDGGVRVEYDDFRVYGPATGGPSDASMSRLEFTDLGAMGVEIKAILGNGGGAPIPAGTVVEFFNGAPETGATKLGEYALAQELQGGTYRQVSVILPNSTPLAGDVVALVDRAASLHECGTADNRVTRRFEGAVRPIFTFDVSSDQAIYSANSVATFTATVDNLGNHGGEVTILMDILATTPSLVIASLPAQGPIAVLAHRRADRPVAWNTGLNQAGDYVARATYQDGQGNTLAVREARFAIIPDASGAGAESSLKLDKTVYSPSDAVLMHSRVTNLSSNHALDNLRLSLSIANPAGQIVYTRDIHIPQLLAKNQYTYPSAYAYMAANPGEYSVEQLLKDGNGTVLDRRIEQYSVVSSSQTGAGLTGTLVATPASIVAGNKVTVQFNVGNAGNSALTGLPLSIAILDPAKQQVLATYPYSANLALQGSYANQAVWQTPAPTRTLGARAQAGGDLHYVAVLTATLNGKSLTLAQATIVVTQPAVAADPAAIPSLRPGALLLLAVLLGLAAWRRHLPRSAP